MSKNFCIYHYLRYDNTPYYVGRGSYTRPYEKHSGATSTPKDKSKILIIATDIDFLTSKAMEIFWIAVYGRKDLGTGILNNRTDGGEGATGYMHTAEHKKYISELQTGRKVSDKTRKKISLSKIGSNNPMYGKDSPMKDRHHTPEVCKRLSEINTGKQQSDAAKQKNSDAHIGKKKSVETRLKMSKPKSAITRQKMSKPKEIIICPHCSKEGGKPAMERWHLDKCKDKK
jgi:hypothetical protein